MSLHQAVYDSNLAKVKNLLDEGVDVNCRDSQENTPLHLVSDPFIASILIDASAVPDLQNLQGDSPLHLWSISLKTGKGGSLLPSKSREIAALLLRAGASPNIANNRGYNVLHSLLVYGGSAGLGLDQPIMSELISLLLSFGVNVNMQDYEGCSPLHHAVKEPYVAYTESLIRAGATVDIQDCRGLTALHHVAYTSYEDTMKFLLNNEADVNALDLDGRTALSLAVEIGNDIMVTLLVQESQTDINLGDKNKVTPLHLAAVFKHVNVTETLVKSSADINALDKFNATPMHYAAYGGTPEIVRLLLNSGADETLRDNSGWQPVQYALHRHYYHTALQFGEVNLRHLKATENQISNPTPIVDVILQNYPADDVYTMLVPASKVSADPYDSSVFPPDTTEYVSMKSHGNFELYLQEMVKVPGIGAIPDIEEVDQIRQSVETFMCKWTSKIGEVDGRFRGTLLNSGSTYEGTKVGDPCEADYMLCLHNLGGICSISVEANTKFDKVKVFRKENLPSSYFDELFRENELQSEELMGTFVDAAKQALSQLNYISNTEELYVESLTDHTLVEETWTLHGTVTCNLKFKWCGLHYKQLVVDVDLVPAIPIQSWPDIARQESYLITDAIRSRGCHLVPKAGFWRVSFSLAEKLIIQNLSHDQRLAFIGAKVVLHSAVSCNVAVYDDTFDGQSGSNEDVYCIKGDDDSNSDDSDDDDDDGDGGNRDGNNDCSARDLSGGDCDGIDEESNSRNNLNLKDSETSIANAAINTGNEHCDDFYDNESIGDSSDIDADDGADVNGDISIDVDSNDPSTDDKVDVAFAIGDDINDSCYRREVITDDVKNYDDEEDNTAPIEGTFSDISDCGTGVVACDNNRFDNDGNNFDRASTIKKEETICRTNETETPIKWCHDGKQFSHPVKQDELAKFDKSDEKSISCELIGRSELSSGAPVTVLKMDENERKLTLQDFKVNDRVNVIYYPSYDCFENEDSERSDDDVPANMIIPYKVISTYFLKTLFLNCIEHNASDGTGRMVTTSQIFGKLLTCLRNKQPIPHYFVPSYDYLGKILEDSESYELAFIATIINAFFNNTQANSEQPTIPKKATTD